MTAGDKQGGEFEPTCTSLSCVRVAYKRYWKVVIDYIGCAGYIISTLPLLSLHLYTSTVSYTSTPLHYPIHTIHIYVPDIQYMDMHFSYTEYTGQKIRNEMR